MSEISELPTRDQILGEYSEIERKATATLLAGNVVPNLLVAPDRKDTRYFISVDAYFPDSAVMSFLVDAVGQVAASESGFLPIQKDYLHVTLAEARNVPGGRKQAGIGAGELLAYYKALRDQYPDEKPIGLRLEKIMLTADAPLNPDQPEKHSLSLVGAFTGIDDRIFTASENVSKVLKEARLEISAPRYPKKLIFVSLGRFAEPPMKVGENFPIVRLISEINAEIPEDRTVALTELEVISTATRVVDSTGHVFVYPRISLNKTSRSDSDPTLLRPKSRTEKIKAR